MQSIKIHPLEYHQYPDLPVEAIELCNEMGEAGELAWICQKPDGTYAVALEPFGQGPALAQ